ncbi:hypothetical protein HOLleu_42631 [Holothuria leucospilota]|uniref:NERD domain-containing protein n=1 Tax=Holothuria leucospilota TaxID=206669 RepID=A0A9Q0YBG3_HOLLE|nr:hypothetical protein HOLleu_42631 [Holothuria leucospilota]
MFELRNRLAHAKEATAPGSHCEDDQIKAGREAERELVNFLREQGVPSSHVFCGLRVPDTFQTKKYEIDIVVLTEFGIYTIEVKNWVGAVLPGNEGKTWIQRKRDIRDDQAEVTYEVNHDNPLEQLKFKTQLLRTHLLRNEACISKTFFHPRVVFTNHLTELDKSLEAMEEIVSPGKYLQFVESFKWGVATKLLNSVVPGLLTGQLSYSAIEAARQILCKVGTWDILHLNGGRQLMGDFKGCVHFSPNREETSQIDFTHQRNATWGVLWAIIGYSPSVFVKMYQRGGKGWFGHATCGSIYIPYNADISFRVAGEEADAKIPANDIESLVLSI